MKTEFLHPGFHSRGEVARSRRPGGHGQPAFDRGLHSGRPGRGGRGFFTFRRRRSRSGLRCGRSLQTETVRFLLGYLQIPEQSADGIALPFLHTPLGNGSGIGRRHSHRGFVGLDLEHLDVCFDRLSGGGEDPEHGCLGNRLPKLRHRNRNSFHDEKSAGGKIGV